MWKPIKRLLSTGHKLVLEEQPGAGYTVLVQQSDLLGDKKIGVARGKTPAAALIAAGKGQFEK